MEPEDPRAALRRPLVAAAGGGDPGPSRGGRGDRSVPRPNTSVGAFSSAAGNFGGLGALSGGGGSAASPDLGAAQRRLLVQAAGRRNATPIRNTTEARSALQRSLQADGECNAICVANGLDLEKLMAGRTHVALTVGGSSGSTDAAPADAERPIFVQGFGAGENLVLHFKFFGGKDFFAFRFGCLVCWSFDTREIATTKELLRPFMHNELPESDLEKDSMEFVVKRRGDDQMGEEDVDEEEEEEEADVQADPVRHDQIILTTSSPFERLAHSYALAQSVRLGVFEISVDRSIAETRSVPETMARTGEVRLEARELSKRMGNLLMLRCDVNLHTDILDTPEIFWDEERFEPHYVACRGYLDIDKRVEILNQRLGVLKDLYDLLQNSLNVKHGNWLEWIIIILILIEVVLEIMELLHDNHWF